MKRWKECEKCGLSSSIEESENFCDSCKSPIIIKNNISGSGHKSTITQSMIETAYKYGKQYASGLGLIKARDSVVSETRMNETSAQDYVYDIRLHI